MAVDRDFEKLIFGDPASKPRGILVMRKLTSEEKRSLREAYERQYPGARCTFIDDLFSDEPIIIPAKEPDHG